VSLREGAVRRLPRGPAIRGRPTHEPGRRWSEQIAPTAGTASCQVERVGLVPSGQAIAKMDYGIERLMKAGGFFRRSATTAGSSATFCRRLG
jgi:hypothetical protein